MPGMRKAVVRTPLVRPSRGDTWESAVWQGMGGSLLSEERHGELVGRLALRVLGGEPIERIPIVAESPARLAFDYRQLQRFGIAPERLPAGAEVFHAPSSFYQIHRSRIIAGIDERIRLGIHISINVIAPGLRNSG